VSGIGLANTPYTASRCSMVWVLAILGLALSGSCEGRLQFEDLQWKKQKTTMADMDVLGRGLERFREESGKELPQSLYELCEIMKLTGNLCGPDAWGNDLYYRVSVDGKRYVLISFGRDGLPEGRAGEGEMFSEERDYDADIVIIDGWWSRSPAGLDRPPIRAR